MQRNIIYLTPIGMEVYLSKPVYDVVIPVDRPKITHSHLCWELLYYRDKGVTTFIINPPMVEHMTMDFEKSYRGGLLFSISSTVKDPICETIRSLPEPTTVIDNFGGAQRLESMARLYNEECFGKKEAFEAEMRLLFVGLARALHGPEVDVVPQSRRSLDNERMVRLNDYFNVDFNNPKASKEELAGLIGVSERQLSRLLLKIYGKNFYDLLCDTRMKAAHVLREQGKGIDEIMAGTGYTSRRTFRRVWKDYFGTAFQEK